VFLGGDFRQIGNPNETILAGERERAVGALSLGDAEYPVVAGVVDRERAVIVNHQPVGIG